MKQRKISIYTVVNSILILLSLTTIGLGIYMTPDNGFFGEFLIALGGTLFGTAVSGVISHFKNKDFFDSVLNILNQNQLSKIHSDENLIREFKTDWHVYYLTINENGEKFWNYYNMNFSSSLAPGILSTEIKVDDNDGIIHKYLMQGLRRESKGPLIIFTKGKNSEEREAIMILPNIGKKYQKYIFGFDFIETWNGQSVISPTIISRNKINGATTNVVDEKTSQRLEVLWDEYSSKDLHYITKK
ncbi:hypothetical protein JQC67_12355 [Aurantibacter crassamenti]|uniref:hypothetical protein n=1 Tax=Aurantibacter crassamenti TaxID=1837375 RepID=UPI00193AD01C|nr:hypothetical protein [Aurantibacter crassamenti]MBM1106934.1 hypothetical protein [Aurantibacter crassamenti]